MRVDSFVGWGLGLEIEFKCAWMRFHESRFVRGVYRSIIEYAVSELRLFDWVKGIMATSAEKGRLPEGESRGCNSE